MAIKNYLSETGLATLWSQINKKCSKYLTEIPVATTSAIGGIKGGEGLSLSADGTLSVVKEAKQSEIFTVNASDWSGSTAPYTATLTLINSYDSTNNNVVLTFGSYSASAADATAYNMAAKAKIYMKSCSGQIISLIAFGKKPTAAISLQVAEV